MLTNVRFGELSMDDDSIADITATLRFDRAILLFLLLILCYFIKKTVHLGWSFLFPIKKTLLLVFIY